MAHVRYVKILTWLRAFTDKWEIFHDSILSKRHNHKENQTKYRGIFADVIVYIFPH